MLIDESCFKFIDMLAYIIGVPPDTVSYLMHHKFFVPNYFVVMPYDRDTAILGLGLVLIIVEWFCLVNYFRRVRYIRQGTGC